MPSDAPFLSFGDNAEDVVLHRALGHVTDGRYVRVGAPHPAGGSATRAFDDRGWTGIAVDPADLGRGLGAVLDGQLSDGTDLHVLLVETEDAALAGVDLRRWRPWVLVVRTAARGAAPQTDGQEEQLILAAGYQFCLFDGVSRFYVADERADGLRAALSVPANVGDHYVPHRWNALAGELAAAREELATLRAASDEMHEELARWRGEVLARWSEAAGAPAGAAAARGGHEVVRLKEELAAVQATVSWRITAPLRALQQRRLREWR